MSPQPSVMLVCERLDLAGGVERFVCQLANQLVQAGHPVSVATGRTEAARVAYPLRPSVQVLRAETGGDEPAGPVRPWARRAHLARQQWRLGRGLARLAREASPDVVVFNGLTTACATLLFMAPRLRARAVCCDHNHFDARSRPWRWLRAWLYPQVAAIVSLTEADRARFAALNPRTVVIPNASALWAERPAGVAEPRVLAVGRHVAQKGFDRLLAAWAQVLPSVPEARLRIVGDGALQGALQAQAQGLGIADRVDWVPPTPRIEDEYRAAAVFVLPSRYEGMPLALLEAQALGLPSVAFDCPTGPREILGEDSGVLVPAGDVQAFAQALVRLLGDPAARARMGHAAIERGRARFSPALHAQRWAALIGEVGARRPGASA